MQRRQDNDCRLWVVYYFRMSAYLERVESHAVQTEHVDQDLFVFVLFSLAFHLAIKDRVLV